MDYKNKTTKISKPYFPTKNKSKDFEYFENFFDGIIGKVERILGDDKIDLLISENITVQVVQSTIQGLVKKPDIKK